MCIVVVDDEPELRDLVSDVLADEGYEVLSFAHPAPVSRLNQTDVHPDLFIIDIMLPDMNGIALAARLREEGFVETPKIAMSASREMLHAASESDLFDAALSKPFDIDDLLEVVERHLAGGSQASGESV
jgi:DNA-binding response OmpR family regulator